MMRTIKFKAPLFLLCTLAILAFGASAAQAETTGPIWKVMAVPIPTNLKPGNMSGSQTLLVTATNVGGSSTDGSRITVGDVLPARLKSVGIKAIDTYKEPLIADFVGTGLEIDGGNGMISCTPSPTAPSCATSEKVDPGDTLLLAVQVDVESGTEGVLEGNVASVSGGGALSASVSEPLTVSSAIPAYGVAKGGLLGASSTEQAGAHPNVTTTYFLNTIDPSEADNSSVPVGAPKDVSFDLPPGLVGTTVGMPRCSMAAVADEAECPRDSMLGTATLLVAALGGEPIIFTVPVFNIAPGPGEPAAFGFNALYFPVRLDTSVLSDGEDNVRVTGPDITTGAVNYMTSITLWGVPAEHNGPGPDQGARDLGTAPTYNFGGPGVEVINENGETRETVYTTRVPFLTNPSQCSTVLKGLLETDSWETPGPGVFATAPASMGAATGCDQLSFKPGISMLPDTLEAGAPAGYSFDLNVPQNTDPESLATPDVKKTTVTLPLGTVISPSAADGLGDCTHEQFFGSGPPEARPATPGNCPRDSQVGTVRVKTPALEERLQGEVYLGAPECTGPGGVCTPADASDGKMVHLYAQFSSEGEDGILIKLEGTGQINQQTGQITTTFANTPQLPFSEFQLTLQGGERATLANPRTCGEVATTADLTPWSTPYTPDASPESKFDIDENCFGPQFNPSFVAGTTSNQAGGFTPFTVAFGRSDSDQFLNGLQVQMPPGLLGMLSRVSLCPEPQASQGTCGPESQIGETTVETGPGADPFLVTGGKVFITGPYKGAPYGLSIVVPAKAGPYTLAGTTGNGTVVNRSAISVNPQTSALTVTADPLPTVLDGIPLQLRLVNVTINRPGFIFNSTSCDKLQVGATLTSTEAASTSGSSSYQVTNCGALAFKPKFTVSTSGKTSKAKGASLDAKVTFPTGSQTKQANIHSFKVDLPKQLPSRLTTLQKACLASVFEANPANCPAASVIGTVRVNTPVLPVQLTGPVYFVSHGGEAFPSLEIVLQGDGVRVDVVAATFISKAGITSSTFKTVPDVPFESFELYLPEGKYSALAANGTLCTSKLAMPTAIVAQNGAEIHESTPIAVTGCPKAKKAAKKKTKKKAKKASNARKSSNGQGGKS
jgi:hypothetical protein